MAKPAITDAVTSAAAFLRAEWPLVLPVALALMALPQAALQLALPAEVMAALTLQKQLSPWLLWSIPVMLCNLVGAIAISALAIVPRLSVGEALVRGLQRLGSLVAATILVSIAFGVLSTFVLLVVGVPLTAMGIGEPGLRLIAFAVTIVMLAVAGIRLFLFLAPGVAADHVSPMAAIRGGWQATRGMFWPLLALCVMIAIVWLVVILAVQTAVGSLLLLLGTVGGWRDVALTLVDLIGAMIGAVLNAAATVIVAKVYRTLAPARGFA